MSAEILFTGRCAVCSAPRIKFSNRGCQSMTQRRAERGGRLGRFLAMLACGLALVAPSRGWAHEDPPGCNETGASINVGIFRDAAATVPLNGAVSPCETIYYRALLTKVQPQVPGDTVCAFSGAQFDFKTPNGVVTVISANVPCIGATVGSVPESCVAGMSGLLSPVISYTVSGRRRGRPDRGARRTGSSWASAASRTTASRTRRA